MNAHWLALQRHYEACFERGGVTPSGVDWPDGADLEARFAVQLGVLRAIPPQVQRPCLLDVGCGPGLLVDYLAYCGEAERLDYRGIDISPTMIAAARERWPQLTFEVRDIVSVPLAPQSVDVVMMNGVLTERRGIARERMVELAQSIVAAAYAAARYGVAFNAMSRHVDWERDDLFHWGFDEVAAFLKRDVTRHFALRADYGLYEFTTFAWREPQRDVGAKGVAWWDRQRTSSA